MITVPPFVPNSKGRPGRGRILWLSVAFGCLMFLIFGLYVFMAGP